jgi:hypothetical protein
MRSVRQRSCSKRRHRASQKGFVLLCAAPVVNVGCSTHYVPSASPRMTFVQKGGAFQYAHKAGPKPELAAARLAR